MLDSPPVSPWWRSFKVTPAELQPEHFLSYPPLARALAVAHLETLRHLPPALLPILLREAGTYDWRFPAEQSRLRTQLSWLDALPPAEFADVTLPFAQIQVPAAAAALDWVNDPSGFTETLTASLWSSRQISAFHDAARSYAAAFAAARPAPEPARPRLVAVIFSRDLQPSPQGAASSNLNVPAKLRASALLLTNVDPADGLASLQESLRTRAAHAPEPFAHWSIDGASLPPLSPAVTSVSYAALQPAREILLRRAHQAMSAERSGPEELRSLMARLTPAEIGLDPAQHPTLARFQLSLLTEGSGTQIFSTTFVQWAARECLRRAEPETLLVRFTPRQRQQGMNELLGGAPSSGDDPAGALADAQMGAYYTWLNLQRLSGAPQARFLLWHEGQTSALLIGPGLPRGATSASHINLQAAWKLLL